MPDEYVVLVDLEDREVGTAEKLEAHREGMMHRAVSVFVFDAGGAMLLQQRASGKYHSAGLWSNACCSHPRPGERTEDAARRRLREEMGLTCRLERVFAFTYDVAFEGGLFECEYDHVFVGYTSVDPVPDAREVASWRWSSIDEVRRAVAESPERFTAWFVPALDGLLARGVPQRRRVPEG